MPKLSVGMLSIEPNKDKVWSRTDQQNSCLSAVNSIKCCDEYLHDDGKDIISNKGGFLPVLGVDVVKHDLHTAHNMQ